MSDINEEFMEENENEVTANDADTDTTPVVAVDNLPQLTAEQMENFIKGEFLCDFPKDFQCCPINSDRGMNLPTFVSAVSNREA
jgi:hypothetical protein